MAEKESGKAGSFVSRGTHFFQECRGELDKVVKPTRQEAMQATTVTLVIIVTVSLVLALFDVIFGRLMLVVLS